MITGRYDYSIEVARRIYTTIKDDAEAIKVCLKCIEKYYEEKGIALQKTTREANGMKFYDFRGGNQSVSLTTMGNKPAQIVLMQYDYDTNRLIENAFYSKESFGLPVFMITIMQDMPQAILSLMNRETYLSLDTPQEQAFHQRMNFLDDIIAKSGVGDDSW